MHSKMLITATVLSIGCTAPNAFPEGPMSDFLLVDTNPNSETFEKEISPRDFIGSISGWYFGHGT